MLGDGSLSMGARTDTIKLAMAAWYLLGLVAGFLHCQVIDPIWLERAESLITIN